MPAFSLLWRRLLSLLPPTVLALVPCLLLWRVVFAGDVFLPAALLRDVAPWRTPGAPPAAAWNPLMWDGIAQFYPWRAFAAACWHQGRLPLWNPYQFCGTPFLANSQSAVFYPPNLLFTLLPVKTAFGASVLLHLTLTGWLMYGFLRAQTVGAGRAAALIGAICWQTSAWQVSWLALPTFLCVSAWLPLALWSVERMTARPTPARAALLGTTLGLILLAGHLQIAFYCVALTGVFALWRGHVTLRGHHELSLRWLAGCALALALMAGLAAPQILPTLELARVSHRAGGAATWAGYANYVRLALPPVNLITLGLSGFFGNPTQGTFWGVGTNGGPSAYTENACSVGLLGLGLALLAVVGAWKQPAARFFALAALCVLLLALGTPLNALLYFGLPGFAQSGSPARILVLWAFCAATLAAVGAQALLSGAASRRAVLGTVGVLLGLLALAFGYAAFWIGQNAPAGTLASNLAREGDVWRLAAGIGIAAVALVALRQRGSLSAPTLGALLAALVATEALAANGGYPLSARHAEVYPVTPAIAFLQAHAGAERIMPLNRTWDLYAPPPAVLPPNAATVYGLRDTQGYDSLLTGRYMAWAAQLDNGSPAPQENGNMVFTRGYSSPQAQEAGARWIVSRGPLPLSGALRQAFTDGDTFVYENRTALPRVRVTAGSGTARIVQEMPTRVTVEVDGASGPGALTVADQWYPGWRTSVNGKETPLLPQPDVFRTVRYTASGPAMRVEMRYQPTTLLVSLYGMNLAFAAIAGIAAYALTRRRYAGAADDASAGAAEAD